MMKHCALILMLFLAQSCATIFSRSSDDIKINSEPEGATVYLNGRKIGETPLTHNFDRKTFVHYKVRLKREGYESKKFKVNKTFNKVAVLNITSAFSWATDALTGNMIEYSPKKYLVEMQRKGVSESQKGPSSRLFVWANRDHILKDISRGEGEYLSAYFELANIPSNKREILKKRLVKDFSALKSYETRKSLYQHMKNVVKQTL